MKARLHWNRCYCRSVICVVLQGMLLLAAARTPAQAATRYVSPAGHNLSPYTNWYDASTNIQDAVDACLDGDVILVTNGTYRGPGRFMYGTNVVTVDRCITIEGSGSSDVIVDGQGRYRCFYVSAGAFVSNLKMINGVTMAGGADGSYTNSGGGVLIDTDGTVSNCSIESCSARRQGGGVALIDGGLIVNSRIDANSAPIAGSGAYCDNGTIRSCWIRNNFGGLYGGVMCNGASGALENSFIAGNSGDMYGGVSMSASTMRNCTVISNSSDVVGGITAGSGAKLYNSIIYHNHGHAADNYGTITGALFDRCCIYPDPGGSENTTNPPLVAGCMNPHLLPVSDCVDAGDNANAVGSDIDKESRLYGSAVDIGCDEYQGVCTGDILSAVSPEVTNVAVNTPIQIWSDASGPVRELHWTVMNSGAPQYFDDTPLLAFQWDTPGTYAVSLLATNDTDSWCFTQLVQVVQGVHYVSPTGSETPPYDSLATAARTLQTAVDGAAYGGRVLIGPAAYELSGETYIARKITSITGIDGPDATILNGGGLHRAIHVAYPGQVSIQGITFTNCYASSAPAIYALWPVTITNCVIAGNRSSGMWGGVYLGPDSRMTDCDVYGNVAWGWGGGVMVANQSVLANSRIYCNVAGSSGGGVDIDTYGLVTGCVIERNVSDSQGGGVKMHGGTITDSVIASNIAYSCGGVYAYAEGLVSNCTIVGNVSTSSSAGGISLNYGSKLLDSIVAGNTSAFNEGGVSASQTSEVRRCVIYANQASNSCGGVLASYGSLVADCVITGNSCTRFFGGGAEVEYAGIFSNCVICSNAAHNGYGGGIRGDTGTGVVMQCQIADNYASAGGGGAYLSYNTKLVNSSLMRNASPNGYGGGVYSSGSNSIVNCTITSNSAGYGGGLNASGAATVRNTILYYNTAQSWDNYRNSGSGQTYEYNCVNPNPGGTGNLTNEPGLASPANPHLLTSSFCVNAGNSSLASGCDIDGENRVAGAAVDIGCDERVTGGITGVLESAISAAWTTAVVGAEVSLQSMAIGKANTLTWDIATNGGSRSVWDSATVRQEWTSAGVYRVRLEAANDSGSDTGETWITVVDGWTNYVSATGQHVAPFDSWSAAATGLAAAVDLAVPGGTVCVDSGTYFCAEQTYIGRAMSIRGRYGPHDTVLRGGAPAVSNRMFYLDCDGARLLDLTIDNCRVNGNGAGVFIGTDGMISNCVIRNCMAKNGGGLYVYLKGTVMETVIRSNTASGFGGGAYLAYGGTLDLCRANGNSAATGGAFYCYGDGCFRNCEAGGNSATEGGGLYLAATAQVDSCTIAGNSSTGIGGIRCQVSGTNRNTVIYGNTGGNWTNPAGSAVFEFCHSAPLPPGVGNRDGNPFFWDSSRGDYRLSTNSPCIDGGTNAGWMTASRDLDGKDRVLGAGVDMGCYENAPAGLDSDGDLIPDWWEYNFCGTATGIVASSDSDGDGLDNSSEYVAATDPNDATSYLRIDALTGGTSNMILMTSSSCYRHYSLDSRTDLLLGVWQSVPGQTNVNGNGYGLSLVDTNVVNASFYRVRAILP